MCSFCAWKCMLLMLIHNWVCPRTTVLYVQAMFKAMSWNTQHRQRNVNDTETDTRWFFFYPKNCFSWIIKNSSSCLFKFSAVNDCIHFGMHTESLIGRFLYQLLNTAKIELSQVNCGYIYSVSITSYTLHSSKVNNIVHCFIIIESRKKEEKPWHWTLIYSILSRFD